MTTVRCLASVLRLPTAFRRLAVAGWLLYTISWITPSSGGRQLGAVAFVEAAKFAWSLLVGESTWGRALGATVLVGWLANFSIVLRLPAWARVVCITAPWLSFAVVLALLPVRPSLPGRAAFFLYFYPWAVGIALIHIANIAAGHRSAVTSSPQ